MSDENGMCVISYELLRNKTIKCIRCEENISEFEEISCCDCSLETWSDKEVYEMIKKVATSKDYIYDPESYEGFDTEKEKQTYINGVRSGFSDAIFWLCDYIGHSVNFETEIYEHFYPKKDKE